MNCVVGYFQVKSSNICWASWVPVMWFTKIIVYAKKGKCGDVYWCMETINIKSHWEFKRKNKCVESN